MSMASVPPRKSHSMPLFLLLTRRQGSSRLAPPYQQADEGSIPPPLHPRRPRFPFRVSLVNPRSLELLDAQLCAFGVMLSPCGTMRATMKGDQLYEVKG